MPFCLEHVGLITASKGHLIGPHTWAENNHRERKTVLTNQPDNSLMTASELPQC